MNIKILILNMAICLILPTVQAQYSFVEKNGVVSIEAEFYTSNKGAWEEVEGRNAYPYEKKGYGSEWTGNKIDIIDNSLFPKIPKGELILAEEEFTIGFGKPGIKAKILAKYTPLNELSTIFYYEKGDKLPIGVAAEKRLCQHLSFKRLNENGKEIYKQTLNWLVGNDFKKKLFIVGEGFEKSEGGDAKLKQWFEALGFDVSVFSSKEATKTILEKADLIVLSESLGEEPLDPEISLLSIPMMISHSAKWGEMGLVQSEKPWTRNLGEYGNAMLGRYGKFEDHLEYSVYFENAGEYDLWLLGRNKGEGLDQVSVFVDAKSIQKGKEKAKVGLEQTTKWYCGDRKVKVSKKGWVNIKIALGELPEGKYRYPNYRIDKIYLTKNGDIPKDDGIPQLLNETQKLPPEMVSNEAFLPKQIWEIKDGIVVIEAEEIDHHSNWELKTDIEGYSGKGYLEWKGPSRSKSIEGQGGNWDELFIKQGPQQEWLILRIKVEEPGIYFVNQKNHHLRVDGDNDTWVNLVEARTYHTNAIIPVVKRQGDSLRDGNLSWLDWGVRGFELKEGINNIYIGGRSIGWGIDQIAVYSDEIPAEKLNAIGIKTSDN